MANERMRFGQHRRAYISRALLIGGLSILIACAEEDLGGLGDTGVADTGRPDASAPDAAADVGMITADAEPADAEPADAEPADAEPADAEPADAEPADAEPADAEPADATADAEAAPDATEDASAPDASPAEDASEPDATPPDTGSDDAGTPDAGNPDAAGPPRSLILIHTNDEHSHVLGFGPELDDYPTPAPATNTEIGGGAKRRARVIQTLREQATITGTPHAVIGAGDLMMGTLFHLADAAGPMVPAVDYAIATVLDYDVLALGEHDFDYGPGVLATALSTGGISPTGMPGVMRIPIVSSNLRFSPTSAGDDSLAALYSPMGATGRPLRRLHVQTFGTGASSVRIGFFGLMGAEAALLSPLKAPVRFSLPASTTPCSAAAPCPSFECLPPATDPTATSGFCAATIDETDRSAVLTTVIADAAQAVADLRAQGVDLVVAVSHAGVNDRELASLALMGLGPENAVLSEDIAIVLGVDAALSAASLRGIDVVIGGHSHSALQTPLAIPNAHSGITTYIAQAGADGRLVGKLKLDQARPGEAWSIDATYSGLERVDTSVSPAGLPIFTELVLNAVIEGVIDALENTAAAVAGDGLIYPGEQCDGTALPNAGACAGLISGATGGSLACESNRQLNLAGCTFAHAACGNGTRGGVEQCDGADLGGQTCLTLGYDGGPLSCNANCTLDAGGCTAYFPSTLEVALNFQLSGWPIRNNFSVRGDLFFYLLGSTSFDLLAPEDSRENQLLNLSADAARWTLNTVDPAAIASPARLAIIGSNVVRDGIQAGVSGGLAISDLFRVLPLGVSPSDRTPGSPLVDYHLHAGELKAMLEVGLDRGLTSSELWLGVSGARVEYDLSRAAGDRITKIVFTQRAQPWGGNMIAATVLYDVSLGSPYPNGATELIHLVSNYYALLLGQRFGTCPRDQLGVPYAGCAGVAPAREIKEYLALIHFIRNFPGGGTIPGEYSLSSPRRQCCVGAACPADRLCPLCGNGVLDAGEGCDDGYIEAGDGCSAICAVESGFSCIGEPSICN